jgi:HD-GYP domain-containing protein (c-di-GMP phosphodiesterase class II)
VANDFEVIEISKVPKSDDGHSLVDLYVHFPYSQKYVKFLVAGDIFDDRRVLALKNAKDPRIFIKAGSLLSAETLQRNPARFDQMKRDAKSVEERRHEFEKKLKEVFAFLKKDPPVSPEESATTLMKMEMIADTVLSEVAPDVDDLRKFLVQNAKYLMVMADSSAIASIAVMTALAHGFDSRAIFRDLALAAILMDAPLVEMGEAKLAQYYKDPTSFSEDEDAKIVRNHPVVAAQAVTIRIKTFSQTVLQLITGHHELYNGKGFPRNTRSEMLPPVVRSFALAVDVFEVMKREKLSGKDITVLDATDVLREKEVEAHLRRHNQKLVTSLANFIKSNMELVGVADEDIQKKS